MALSDHDLSLGALDAAAATIREVLAPTPQYDWPLLSARCGCRLWVKHENHLPVGAFKLRGGIVYVAELRRSRPEVRGVIVATRGNHGQSVAWAASRAGMTTTVVVPRANNPEKNAAMRALGAELIEHGDDFQAAYERAVAIAGERSLHLVPSFHPALVRGVASWSLELMRAVPTLTVLYVPIGLGSGICGAIAARDALGLTIEIVGVVAQGAPTYADSFAAGRPVPSARAQTIADGIACRVPDADALRMIRAGASRIVAVSEADIAAAMTAYLHDTHNLAEGAAAAALAAVVADRERNAGRDVGVVLSGGNVDAALLRSVVG
ncbi:MAG TPA: threonine dehydratase [Planctomycetota bacterium]|nr:threonine dehydratase [Planctomycetota bacterium]